MAEGEMKLLFVGQSGKVKNILARVQGRGGRDIPSSVIKTGFKLPQLEDVTHMEKVKFLCNTEDILLCMLATRIFEEGQAGSGVNNHLAKPIPEE